MFVTERAKFSINLEFCSKMSVTTNTKNKYRVLYHVSLTRGSSRGRDLTIIIDEMRILKIYFINDTENDQGLTLLRFYFYCSQVLTSVER